MTVHVLLADPPWPGLALPRLVEAGPLDPAGAARLAAAAVKDAAAAVEASGGDLLVNYPEPDQLPGAHRTGESPAAALRDLVGEALGALDDVRFEPQVGGSFDARAGNAVTHLLETADADSVAVLDGRAPTLDRTTLDSAAMKLRRSAAVVAPAPAGRVAYVGFTAPIDFAGAWAPPELPSLVDRSLDAGHEVDFLPVHPRLDDPAGLATLVALVEARRAAGRRVPVHTAAAIESLGLRVVAADGERRVEVGSTDSA